MDPMRFLSTVLLVGLLFPAAAFAQPTDPAFDAVMARAQDESWHALPMGALMQRIGEQFIGRPYAAGLLDEPGDEVLLAPLDRFDCVLFVESVLGLARTVAEGQYDRPTFLAHIRDQRYRNGEMDGYCSRLHYFTEWISDNARRGTVRDMTRELGGRLFDKQRTFMGEHRMAYAQLAASDSLFAALRAIEDSLRDETLYVLPQGSLRGVYDRLRAGDIIAFATSVAGLDVSHTGLVYDLGDGRRGVLHASLDRGVVVSTDLQSYVENNRSQVGIVVARAEDPRGDSPRRP